jgi:hypothetical protein
MIRERSNAPVSGRTGHTRNQHMNDPAEEVLYGGNVASAVVRIGAPPSASRSRRQPLRWRRCSSTSRPKDSRLRLEP